MKIGSAGFAGIYGERSEVRITVQVKNADWELGENAPVCLVVNRQEIQIGRMELTGGCGSFERKFALEMEGMRIGASSIGEEEIMAVRITSGAGKVIEGRLRSAEIEGKAAENNSEEKERIEKEGAKEEKKEKREEKKENKRGDKTEGKRTNELEALQKQDQTGVRCQENYSGNKWEQLKNQYKAVHPFGDEREFISIELKDFVVLGERYQRLINNSFLLHGFYNYRHLILGKDRRIGADREVCFYLGVPGVFFEREKMVAIMFGFEGFECAGPVEIGKFGYYLRSVEI